MEEQKKEQRKTIKVELEVMVTAEDIDDILCGSMEGGSNYWCDRVEVIGDYLGKYASEQISRGGKLRFHVDEPFDDEDTEWYEMDQEKFLHGFQEWLNNYPDVSSCLHKNELDCGQIDAGMADSIVQYAIFGEVMFG